MDIFSSSAMLEQHERTCPPGSNVKCTAVCSLVGSWGPGTPTVYGVSNHCKAVSGGFSWGSLNPECPNKQLKLVIFKIFINHLSWALITRMINA